MHCASCVVLTESELSQVPGITKVKASLDKLSVEISGDFGEKSAEDIAKDLSKVMEPHGYALLVEKEKESPRWAEFRMAIPFAAAFIVLFIVLQKTGLVNLVNTSDVSYGTAFLIGLIASVSTCMAVVGGLVLSMSASFAKEGDKVRPQVMFHVGRLISFFILGGVIGVIGSIFQFGGTGTLVLNIAIAIILFVLGINLLDVFPFMKRFQPTLPGFVGKRVHALKTMNHTLTPFLVGAATFLLPCGFTQSMQFYTLTTGSFWTGALTMFTFALGTLPVLSILSFSSLGIRNSSRSGIFFKAAGIIVVFFAVMNLLGSLAGAGMIPPILTF